MTTARTFAAVAKALVPTALRFCACNLLAAVLAAQCSNPTQVPNQTISSGTWHFANNNALAAGSVVISGSASVTFVAGNCIQLSPGFQATAGTAGTTFRAWVATPPSAVSVSPSSGSGLAQQFTFTGASPYGYGHLSEIVGLFNTSVSGANGCYIRYNRASNLLHLADNSGSNWLGGFAPGSAGSASNSYCSISGAGSSFSAAGTQLSVTVAVTFQTTFAGVKNEYLNVYDNEGLSSTWQQVGTWAVGGSGTPTITGLSPSVGPAGTAVTISGASFSTSGTVTFNGVPASTSSWTSNSITAIVPAGAASGNVVVTVGGVPSNGFPFTVIASPTITGLSPSAGPIGAAVTIAGANFGATQGASTLTFNGVASTATNWTATSISTNVPAGATSGNVVVTVGGVASNGVPFSVTTAPTISGLSATSGPVGASITITGANFGSSQGTNTVKFNGAVASVSSWGATSITATVPAGATSGNVIVTVGGVASNGIFFSVTSGPGITSLTPNAGPAGAAVVIAGTNFGATQGSGTVTFNGSVGLVSHWSATSISVTVPAGASTGNVVVTVGGVASNGVPFTVNPAPAIAGLFPSSGQPGATVIANGSGFGAAQGTSTVKFNGITAAVSSWTATSITTAVPGGATSGNVVVTVAGVASNGMFFTVINGPTITSISPAAGPVGATVTITGTNFGTTQGSSSVTFNGAPAAVTAWSATSISATVPAGATSGNVVVTVSGIASNGFEFSVFPPPVITGLAPASGAVGTAVTVTGSDFGATQGTSSVRFNGTTAAVTSWSATSIIAQVPAGATTGLVSVVVNGMTAYSPQNFTVNTTAAPNITSITPSTAPAGWSVTIAGADFGSSQGTSTVTFNGVQAAAISWSASSIIAAVPQGASSGNVVVQVNSLSSNPFPFTVGAPPPSKEYIRMAGRVVAIENPPPPVLPVISGVSPASGAAGAAVTISGSNFGASQGTSSVRFNGTTAAVTSWSATSISTTVPAGATTGNVVVTVNGFSSNGVMFSVTAAETVSTPSIPAGTASGFTNASYLYTTGGSVSSLGNPVQYLFNWGDGTNSGWLPGGTAAASHAWTSTGAWAVTAQARSVTTGVLSNISSPLYVSLMSGYANLSISGSFFYTYNNWTLWLYTNIPNTWFTMCAIRDSIQSCTPNWGRTDANGNWVSTGSFPPGNAGSWREWVEFPTAGTRSNDIVFTVSDFATLSISSGFRVGNPWTLSLHTSIPNTWFTICAIHGGIQSCTPNWAQTDAYGNWTSTGSFSANDLGSWQEWIVFPTVTSNTISFTVNP